MFYKLGFFKSQVKYTISVRFKYHIMLLFTVLFWFYAFYAMFGFC